MSARDNDTDSLVDYVRTKCFLAQSGQSDNWTADRILLVGDECTLKFVAPALKRAKVGWFRVDFDLALEADVARYDTPEEAMWNSLEAAWLTDITTGQVYSKINVVEPSNRELYGNLGNSGTPLHAWFDHSQVVFSPPPSSDIVSSYSCTVGIYRRPGQMVQTNQTVRITSVNSVTQECSISAVAPSDWAQDAYTSGTPYRLDFYDRDLPNTRLLWNKTCDVTSQTLTFSPSVTADEFDSLSVGDVVTMKGTSPYPDVPPEGVPYLQDMIVRTILTAQTDLAALQTYLGQQAESLANCIRGMGNRADGSPRKLSMANAAGARFIRNYGARYRR